MANEQAQEQVSTKKTPVVERIRNWYMQILNHEDRVKALKQIVSKIDPEFDPSLLVYYYKDEIVYYLTVNQAEIVNVNSQIRMTNTEYKFSVNFFQDDSWEDEDDEHPFYRVSPLDEAVVRTVFENIPGKFVQYKVVRRNSPGTRYITCYMIPEDAGFYETKIYIELFKVYEEDDYY